MAFIDPEWFEEPDPFTRVQDAFAEKLKMTEQPFASKFLNEWALRDRRGGLKLFSYDGTVPVYFIPERDRTPCILFYGATAPAPEPMGEGNKEIQYTLNFEGWMYTEDQRKGNSFYWHALCALFFPWMQPIDPVGSHGFVQSYYPIDQIGPRPWSESGDRGKQPMVWEITVGVTLASASFPFMRGI
jgi:hypothetical protein